MYTAYVLTAETREALEEKYPPTYPEFIGHHITVDFGLPEDAPVPEEADNKLLGIKDSGDGIEALLVTVNGETKRPDGKSYHITWSLDREHYKPVDSNALVESYQRHIMSLPYELETTPELLK